MANATLETLSSDEKAKIKAFLTDGCRVMQEIDDSRGGLSDTAKAIADELGIKKATLMKSLRMAYKSTLEEEKENMDIAEELLAAAGL